MSLDKAIEHGKEKRKPYRGSKAIDCTCRNHGSCEWCKENRKHKFRDKKPPDFDIGCDMNRKKNLYLTAMQIEMLGGYDKARSMSDGREIILVPDWPPGKGG